MFVSSVHNQPCVDVDIKPIKLCDHLHVSLVTMIFGGLGFCHAFTESFVGEAGRVPMSFVLTVQHFGSSWLCFHVVWEIPKGYFGFV